MSEVQGAKKTTEAVARNQSGTPKPRSDSSSSIDSTISGDGRTDYAVTRNPESPSAAEIPQITSDRRNSFLKLL